MTGSNGSRNDLEDRLLRRLQIISGAVFLIMVFGMAVIDSVGRLLVNPEFHVSEVLFGTSVGALLALVGVTALRLPKRGGE